MLTKAGALYDDSVTAVDVVTRWCVGVVFSAVQRHKFYHKPCFFVTKGAA